MTQTVEPVYTTLADSQLAELVELFVAELPLRVATIEHELSREHREGVCRAAHQLKGAAASYGFGELALYAGRIEAVCRDYASPVELLERAVDDLITFAERVRA